MAESCIVDLSRLGTKAAERRFMLAFLDAIYRKADGEPFHLVFDEADLWAPQKPPRGEREAAGADGADRPPRPDQGLHPLADHAAAGGAEQGRAEPGRRPDRVQAHRSQDRDALGGWIEGQADKAEGKAIKARCRRCSVGPASSGCPGAGILETVAFPEKVTFDSSRRRSAARRSSARRH
jgi:hypothetical protein